MLKAIGALQLQVMVLEGQNAILQAKIKELTPKPDGVPQGQAR